MEKYCNMYMLQYTVTCISTKVLVHVLLGALLLCILSVWKDLEEITKREAEWHSS